MSISTAPDASCDGSAIPSPHRTAAAKIAILQSFCATESDPRPHLHKPFIRSGFAWATNGHFLARCPADGLELEVWDADKKPNVEAIFAAQYGKSEFAPMPALSKPPKCGYCSGRGWNWEEECLDCDGEGDFDHGSHNYTCKECEGEGFLASTEHVGKKSECRHCYGRGHEWKAKRLGAAPYQLTYLWQIAKHGAEFASRENPHAGSFRFGEFEGLLMPIRDEAA